MMKKVLSFIFALVLSIGLASMNVFAAETTVRIPEGWGAVPISTDEHSNHLAYKIENGVLTFHDFGDPLADDYGIMPKYTNTSEVETKYNITPWYQQRSTITKVVFDETISSIGAYTLTNMDQISEIHIENPDAGVAPHTVLFSTTQRQMPLKIYAASTIATQKSWIRGNGNRKLSEAIANAIMYYTDLEHLAPELKGLEEKLLSDGKVEPMTLWRALVLLDAVPGHAYSLSDYRVGIEGAEEILQLLWNLSSGSCGDSVSYQLTAMETEGQLNLIISGSGAMESYAAASRAPWANVTDCISDVTFADTVIDIPAGILPKDATYHVYVNSEAFSYAKVNDCRIQIDRLRILCIGNSHTADYSEFCGNILADLKNAGLETEIVFTRTIIGSIGLYSGRNSNVNATYRSHLEAIRDQAGAYSNLKNHRYDLIIVQDYMESIADNPEVFAKGLANFIETIKSIAAENGNGKPNVAWFADWVDIRTTGADNALRDGEGNKISLDVLTRQQVYVKSLACIAQVEAAIAKGTAFMPDFVIHSSTIKQNAMSSYLGTTMMWDKSSYCLLERDTTHMTYELGRYLMGVGVVSEIVNYYGDMFALGKNGTNVGAALTIQNGPVASGTGCQYEGSVNENLLDVIREAVSSPNMFHSSIYTVDPVGDFLTEITGMKWNLNGVTDQASAMESVKTQIATVYGDKLVSFAVEMEEYTSAAEFTVAISIRYGYSTAQATVEIIDAPIIITKQPMNCEVTLGERFAVTVEAEGTDLTYRWYYRDDASAEWSESDINGSSYSGVMSAALGGREVYCVVTDANGKTATSDTDSALSACSGISFSK